MNVTVAAASPSPTAGAPCAGICSGDAMDGVDFAAVLLSLSATTTNAASPETLLGALGDRLPGETEADAETPVGEGTIDPLQNLLAGLLAIPAAKAVAAAGAGAGEAPIDGGGDEIAAPEARGAKRGAAEAATLLAAKAEAAGKQAETPAAVNPLLPAAAKLADGALATAADARAADPRAAAAGEDGSLLAPTQQTLATATQHNPARGAAAVAHVQTPVGSPAWAGDMAQRVVMLARSDVQSAQITLNPAHLGPLEVRLSISGGEATAVFVSAHGDVREALESALPRLREMFASAGIQLGQAQVNAQSTGSGGQGEASGRPASLAQRAEVAGGLADNDEIRVSRPLARGLVDTFA